MSRFETHSHSHFSNIRIIDSTNKPIDLILTAAKLGYKGIALTDHEALCGHIEWLELEQELKEKEKIPKDFVCALGNEIYLIDERHPKQKYYHFLLIAKNDIGHRALRELSSTAWLNGYKDRGLERVPTLKSELEAIVRKYPNSLIADTACIGGQLGSMVLELIQAEQLHDEAQIYSSKLAIDNFLKWCIDLFGDDFYIEVAPGTSKDQIAFNNRVKSIAQFYHRKIVVGTDAHYLTEDYREIHKSFLNSKDGDREVESFYHDTYLMDDDEAFSKLEKVFSREEFDEMCQNSLEIMGKITGYNLFHNAIIPEVAVDGGVPIHLKELDPYPNLQYLRESDNPQEREWVICCLEALKEKKKEDKAHFERLELEADVIRTVGTKLGNCLFSYFNTFKHYIDLFWECGSVVGPGRGCFVPDSKVLMGDGQEKNIQDVIAGERVFTHLGYAQLVERRLEYDCDENLYKIYSQNDNEAPIMCTNNHQLWALKGCRPGWIEAQNLSENDYISYPKPRYRQKVIQSFDLSKFIEEQEGFFVEPRRIYSNLQKRFFNRFIKIDKEFLYVVGTFIRDGWISIDEDSSYLGFTFDTGNEIGQQGMKRCVSWFESIGLIPNYKDLEHQPLVHIGTSCQPLVKFFYSLAGHGNNKQIPFELLYNDKEDMYALFEGIMDSKRSYNNEKLEIVFGGTNRNLITQVKNLWAYLGIYGTISVKEIPEENTKSYRLRARGQQLNWLIEKNQWIYKEVSNEDFGLIIKKDYFFFRIEKIETEHYCGKVYDLTVANNHSYVINNACVHNSSGSFLSNHLLGMSYAH